MCVKTQLTSVFLLILACAAARAQCVVYPVAGAGRMSVVPCEGFVRGPAQSPIVLPAFKPLTWGTTAAQIEANFAANILYDFETNPNLNAVIGAAPPGMLARLSTELKALDTTGQTYWILRYAMAKVSPANMQLLHAVFGDNAMAPVVAYMPAAVRAAYVPVLPTLYSQMAINCGTPALPPYDLTQRHLYDVYLEQYFSTGDTPAVALHKAMLYAQVRIREGVLVTVGTVVGIVVGVIEIYKFTQSTEYDTLKDWFYFQSVNPAWESGKSVTVVPDQTLGQQGWPALPDPEMTEFPSIDGSGDIPAMFLED